MKDRRLELRVPIEMLLNRSKKMRKLSSVESRAEKHVTACAQREFGIPQNKLDAHQFIAFD
jgi:hypothetical protein